MRMHSGAEAHGVLWTKVGSTCQALSHNNGRRALCQYGRDVHLPPIRLPSGQRGLVPMGRRVAPMLSERGLHIQQGGQLADEKAQQHPHPNWVLA